MKRLAFLTSMLVFMFSPMAQAGFQWMPPASAPQEPVVQSAPAAPSYQQGDMGAFPAQPVMSEPLGQSMPTSILPNEYAAPYQTGQQVQNFKGDMLVIDPYPLRDNQANSTQMEFSESSVQQAMVEESQMLNPLPLGAGMKTGAQPVRAIVPSAYGIGNMQMASNNAPLNHGSGLTPMVGGEPAPLPGMKVAHRGHSGSAPMHDAHAGHYSEAVGFGKDLPLALALSQIIPPDYNHSYAMGVNAGTTVDWEGGKPWNLVLEDMLRPHNMGASIQGNQVIITPL